MKFSAVYHRTSEQMSYAFSNDELIINLKTGKDVDRVFLVHGDPYEAGIAGGAERWSGTREEVCFKKLLKDHIWWTTTVRPEYKRCKYYFELYAGDEVWYFFENGFLTKEQMEIPGKMLQYFIVPWMNPADVNVTPDWVNDTVWYQIFPDRFCRGEREAAITIFQNEPSADEEDIVPWRKGEVSNSERFGGNLAGITQKIPYLAGLGIGGIYLTPICAAESNHKYDTTDYERIDPGFGTEEDMKRLVKLAHENGIRVMMDGVFNHSGTKFAPWQDVLEKGHDSRYFDWFMINDDQPIDMQRDTRDGRYYTFAFHAGMPKLNTNNEEVIDYIEKVCVRWVEEYGIDGIRFDVGNEVSHYLLKRLRRTLKKLKPDIYLLGELWHDSIQWMLGDEYDAVMNYPLTSGINDFFIDHSLTKDDFAYRINACYTMYQQQNNNVLFNLLDSHDTDRLMTRVGDRDVFIQELAALFTMPGSVCIFYGTELGLEGGHDPDCRRCMPWDELEEMLGASGIGGQPQAAGASGIGGQPQAAGASGTGWQPQAAEASGTGVQPQAAGASGAKEDVTLYEEVRSLIALRTSEPAFRSLYFHFPNEIPQERCVEYIKLDAEGNRIQILLNASGEEIPVEGGEILFARGYRDGGLAPKGTLIRRI